MKRLFAVAAVMALSGCALDKPAVPAVAGPSELGLSLQIIATPDIITQDGQSQAFVEVIARDANGQPVPRLPLRAEIAAQGVIVDFGTLSSKSVWTDDNGRATLTYSSPGAPPPAATGDALVSILVTPVNGNYANALSREVQIRLTRPGVILPPNGSPRVSFYFSPTQPRIFEEVLFDGSASTDPDGTIVSYTWHFGDGSTRTRSEPRTSHEYGVPGTYNVVLTITDDRGQSVSSDPQQVTVGAAQLPSADFSFSPTTPEVTKTVFFSAETSTAAPGRTIVNYAWNFGNGTTGSGLTPSTSFSEATTYTVTLVVTDDQGSKSAVSRTVTVCPPGGCAAADDDDEE